MIKAKRSQTDRAIERQKEAENRRLNTFSTEYFPAYVVWEITLACDQHCTHCGSRAIDPRQFEITLADALLIVAQLKEMKAREVVLIGGEAYLHPDFLEIIKALDQAGMTVVMTTGGYGIDQRLAEQMSEAGLKRCSVSIDGIDNTHDLMRAKKGSFQQAVKALGYLRHAGIDISVNSNFNRFNERDLEALYFLCLEQKVKTWQIQLTSPLGRAADRSDMLFQPFDLLDFVPRVARLKERGFSEGLLIMPGNNLGFFGPEEGLLRSQRPHHYDHFQGCQAGKYVLGIESDGAVKGCPSLQPVYISGNLKQSPLKTQWDQSPILGFARTRTVDDLSGYCKKCVFAEVCLGGCSFTAHAFFGKTGNQPYCHYRAIQMKKEGLRERVIPIQSADGLPFDHALFEIITEDFSAPLDRDEVGPWLLKIVSLEQRQKTHLIQIEDETKADNKSLK